MEPLFLNVYSIQFNSIQFNSIHSILFYWMSTETQVIFNDELCNVSLSTQRMTLRAFPDSRLQKKKSLYGQSDLSSIKALNLAENCPECRLCLSGSIDQLQCVCSALRTRLYGVGTYRFGGWRVRNYLSRVKCLWTSPRPARLSSELKAANQCEVIE